MDPTTLLSQHSAIARGNRLKQARKLARLTLRAMSENSEINFNTLCGWESGRHGGLTKKGAEKVVDRLLEEGLLCSAEWLLFGTGNEPTPILSNELVLNFQPDKVSLKDFIPNQIKLIERQFPTFIGLIIQDRAMEPYYCYGDYVTGLPLPEEKIEAAVGKIVIAKLDTGKVYCRQLLRDQHTGNFSLVALNLADSSALIQNVNITQCALVLGHFRYDSLYS